MNLRNGWSGLTCLPFIRCELLPVSLSMIKTALAQFVPEVPSHWRPVIAPRPLGKRLAMMGLLALAGWMAQAACLPHQGDAKAAARFDLHNETATDRTTGLEWMRCPAGTCWSNGACLGQARMMRLDEARQWVKTLGQAWRLPGIEELSSLIENRCSPPAVNARVFPGIGDWVEGGAPFWSNTPIPDMPPLVYFIDFYRGEMDGRTPRALNAVRAVRDSRTR